MSYAPGKYIDHYKNKWKLTNVYFTSDKIFLPIKASFNMKRGQGIMHRTNLRGNMKINVQ